MTYLDAVRERLAELDARALRREVRAAVPAGARDFASNDYLGLSRDPRVLAALRGATRAGSGGSRLLSGAHAEHAALEQDLAAWTGRERALLFSSGYLAAFGAICGLAPFVRHAYSDASVHACAIDALRLARLPRTIYPHRTLPPRDERTSPAFVVTETLFGMSGARIDTAALVASLGSGDVAIVDEAHALGIAGASGGGLASALRDERVVVIGTLSKALGGAGGFVAGAHDAIAYLASAARTFVFDTALPPATAAAIATSLAIARSPEGDDLRARLGRNVARLCALLADRGAFGDAVAETPGEPAPIVPIPVGDAATALALGRALEARGIFAPAIRPPTVPAGAAQLRVTVRADHTDADLVAFADAFAAVRLAVTA